MALGMYQKVKATVWDPVSKQNKTKQNKTKQNKTKQNFLRELVQAQRSLG